MAAKKKINSAGQSGGDDEFSLQPLSSESTVSKTHRAPNARDQILSQIHTQNPVGADALPDLPPDAPEYETPPTPPMFTTMALIRAGVLLLILVAVSIFVFDVYRHEFGRPIAPTAPAALPPTAAELTRPMAPETPLAPLATETTDSKKMTSPSKPAAAAAAAVHEPAPELGTIQEELLSPYELSLKKDAAKKTEPAQAGAPDSTPQASPPPPPDPRESQPPPTARAAAKAQAPKP